MTMPEAAQIRLPPQPTPFIGRAEQREKVAGLLTDPSMRVLTLVGIGGVGKTRLALAAAEDVESHFADGAAFVPLSPLSSPHQVPDAIAKVMGFAIDTTVAASPLAQIGVFLRHRHMLIVLDNFEHLIEAAPMVQELALAAPRVELLVTSRERLSIRAEQVLVVEGLAMDAEAEEDYDKAVLTDPVQLFIGSAQRTRVDFEFTPDDLPAFRRICTLVEGVPLGLELAASWVDALSLSEIADEIQRGLDFLETNARDIPDRQRSLRAAFEYSWQRLTLEERDHLCKLSIFCGGFTRRAALAVAGVDLRMLQSFINKSLLRRTREERYEIHEVLRAFAAIHLEEAGQADAAREAHSRYYMERLRIREADIKGADQLAGLDALDNDIENFRLAWKNALDRCDWAALIDGLDCLFWYCLIRNRYRDGDALFQQAEYCSADEFKRRTRVRRVWLKRWVSGAFNPAKGEVAIIETGLREAILAGDTREAAICRVLLGDALIESDPKQSEESLRDALDAFDGELADPFYAAWALHFMAKRASVRDGALTAIPLHHESIERRRLCGDRAGEIYALFNLGYDVLRTGELEEAAQIADTMHQASVEIAERSGILMSSIILTLIAYVEDELEAARALNATNRRIAADLNHRLGASYAVLLDLLLVDAAGGAGEASSMDAMALQLPQSTVTSDMYRVATLLVQMRDGKTKPSPKTATAEERAVAVNEALDEPLTDRELEILGLLGEGLNNNEIADRLVVGLSTVKKHITHLYGKLDVTTRTQAILKGQELGLIG